MNSMGKATLIGIIFILLIPIPVSIDDGDTTEYRAITYKVTDVHRYKDTYSDNYLENGIIIEIFGHEVYNNVSRGE